MNGKVDEGKEEGEEGKPTTPGEEMRNLTLEDQVWDHPQYPCILDKQLKPSECSSSKNAQLTILEKTVFYTCYWRRIYE